MKNDIRYPEGPEALQNNAIGRPRIEVCMKGHPRTKKNTSIAKDGTRSCKICKSDATKRWKKRKREQEREFKCVGIGSSD